MSLPERSSRVFASLSNVIGPAVDRVACEGLEFDDGWLIRWAAPIIKEGLGKREYHSLL